MINDSDLHDSSALGEANGDHVTATAPNKS